MASFALNIAAFAKRAKADTALVAGKVTLEIFRRVIMKSPVDTGRFRGNWEPSEGEASSVSNPNTMDKRGSAAIEKSAALIPANRGGVFYLANNLPYAQRLEDGYSGQAPVGMVKLTCLEFPGIVKEVAQ
jgi:hypothetical protein